MWPSSLRLASLRTRLQVLKDSPLLRSKISNFSSQYGRGFTSSRIQSLFNHSDSKTMPLPKPNSHSNMFSKTFAFSGGISPIEQSMKFHVTQPKLFDGGKTSSFGREQAESFYEEDEDINFFEREEEREEVVMHDSPPLPPPPPGVSDMSNAPKSESAASNNVKQNESEVKNEATTLLIDGYQLVFRSYHSHKHLTLGAVYGFTKSLLKLIEDFQPTRVGMFFLRYD